MKKITEFFKNILLMIVYPNRILNLFKIKNLDHNSYKLLSNELVVKILALILAMVLVVVARHEPPAPTEHYDILHNVPLTVTINENYTHFGSSIPSQINVRLTGDATHIAIFMATEVGSVSANLDLTRLEPGEYDFIPITVEGITNSQIVATAIPNMISEIRIARIEERQFPLTLTTNHRYIFDELDSRYGYNISFYPEYVTIRAPEVILDTIVEVRAIFNAINVEAEVGTTTHEAIVVANDIVGNQVAGITSISHPAIGVSVEIYEDLQPLTLEVNDNLLGVPSGYRILGVTPNFVEIFVWGATESLPEAIELPRFNFADLDDDGQITIPINLPAGVYSEVTEVEIIVNFLDPPETNTDQE